MKSSRVLMHIDLTCMDMTALTQRKNFSTCRSDSPLFLKVRHESDAERGFVILLPRDK